jgi:hypothetical protein
VVGSLPSNYEALSSSSSTKEKKKKDIQVEAFRN